MKQNFQNIFFYAFLPWMSFWQQEEPRLRDGHMIFAQFSEDQCKKTKSPTLTLEIARSNGGRQKGLSFRKDRLKKDTGMIFIFEDITPASFWMKNTLIPLQILYLNSMGQVFQEFEMKVEADPNHPRKFYNSNAPVNVAIELNPKTVAQPIDQTLCFSMIKTND